MSPTRPRRTSGSRRLLPAVVALLALVAAACTEPSNDPEGYDETVRENFVEGCTGEIPGYEEFRTGLSEAVCECRIRVFEAMVPFDGDDYDDRLDEDGNLYFHDYPPDAPTFRDVTRRPREEDDRLVLDELPAEVREELDACDDDPDRRIDGADDTEDPDGEDPDAEDVDGEEPDGEDPDAEDVDGEEPDAEDVDGEEPEGEDPDAEDVDGEEPDAEDADGEDA